MSCIPPPAVKEEVGSFANEPTQKHLARLLLDVGTSDLVLKGVLPGRLTQQEAEGLVKVVNSPLTSEDFDAMDRESSFKARLTKDQVYIVLILLIEAHWDRHDVAALFNVGANYISAVRHMKCWPATFQRYARDRGLDAYELANPQKGYSLPGF
jgi:hypothetical protein